VTPLEAISFAFCCSLVAYVSGYAFGYWKGIRWHKRYGTCRKCDEKTC
jgi:hypothetical protein